VTPLVLWAHADGWRRRADAGRRAGRRRAGGGRRARLKKTFKLGDRNIYIYIYIYIDVGVRNRPADPT